MRTDGNVAFCIAGRAGQRRIGMLQYVTVIAFITEKSCAHFFPSICCCCHNPTAMVLTSRDGCSVQSTIRKPRILSGSWATTSTFHAHLVPVVTSLRPQFYDAGTRISRNRLHKRERKGSKIACELGSASLFISQLETQQTKNKTTNQKNRKTNSKQQNKPPCRHCLSWIIIHEPRLIIHQSSRPRTHPDELPQQPKKRPRHNTAIANHTTTPHKKKHRTVHHQKTPPFPKDIKSPPNPKTAQKSRASAHTMLKNQRGIQPTISHPNLTDIQPRATT